ncbi:Hypothetical predicted protein [Mytilus galloprovincialis]|uniref:Integrase catalytic domain-containing protein n=1 Tax=Mytilus galloprovincialis TaxID=29158 RepID=A0A8B6DG45_MYTGA|nr:Hypothetical predicted protein [Mytilus galloprovincialis]
MKSQEAEEIANNLYSEIFTRYGACRYLVSDRHASNLSKLVNIVCKMFNVTQHFTSSYLPQSNVTCERTNSTLAQSLRAYCSEQQTKWPEVLPSIMMAFRMSPNLAETNLEDAQLKSKTYYDKSTRAPNFKVGDHVLLKLEKVQIGKKKKLEPKWTGPFSILENRHDLIYKLLNLTTLRPLKSFIHANRLKLYKDPIDHRQPPNLLINNDDLDNYPGNENQQDPDNFKDDDLSENESHKDNSQSDLNESKSNQNQDKSDEWYDAIKLLTLKWMSGKKTTI